MTTSAGMSRTPYLYQVAPRVCACRTEPKQLGRARTFERAVELIAGYWNVYIGFFGDQVLWLHFEVIDLRDGQVVWRNGRPLSTEEGQLHGTNQTGNPNQHQYSGSVGVARGRRKRAWLD